MINEQLRIGDIIEVLIKKIGINGEGIGYYHKMAIFVENALPDEVVDVKIDEIFETRITASIVEIKTASPDRLEVMYPEYELCGAFSMQHLTYKRALTLKRDILINSLNRYVSNKINYKMIKQTIGMENPLGYRNKVSLPVRKIDGKNRFGLYAKGGNEFIPVNDTPVQNPRINEMIQTLERVMDEFKFDAYIQKEKSGYVKSVVIRRSHFEGQVQISFLLMKPFDQIEQVALRMVEMFPEVVSVFAFFTEDYKEQVFFSNNFVKVYGKATINERMNGQIYSLYPESFFQLNTVMAQNFYKKMVEMADLKPTDVVIDAYAGIAPVSHFVANSVSKVYAIEIDQRSVQSAILSLKRNNIKNVTVLQSDFTKALKNLGDVKIDAMFFDPPRTGLGYDTIKQVLKYKPTKLVYGSCNPSTLAKDLEMLANDYDVKEIVPMDMFPYTPLVESVTLLTLKNNN